MRACVRIYRFSNVHSAISRIGFAVPTGARAIGSAETIEKWVNRSNVLPAALRLSRRSRFLFSRAQRLFHWNSNAPNALLYLFSPGARLSLSLSSFNGARDFEGDRLSFDPIYDSVSSSSNRTIDDRFRGTRNAEAVGDTGSIMPTRCLRCSAGACCTRSWRSGRPPSRSHRGTLWLLPGVPRG